MVMHTRYDDFVADGTEQRTVHGNAVTYSLFRCPYAKCSKRVAIPKGEEAKQKASKCLRHLVETCEDPAVEQDSREKVREGRAKRAAAKDAAADVVAHTTKKTKDTTPQQKRHQSFSSRNSSGDGGIVTIYALKFLPTNRRVYTGKTKNANERLKQHGRQSSSCRLVRNAMRKHGRHNFAIEPIMRCHTSDADTNESFWIQKNCTMYPDGYNLRHGSKAGEAEDGMTIVAASTNVIQFESIADEARACAEAWLDIAQITEDFDEEHNAADKVCKDFLREIHPDKQRDNVYSATDVAAMLNTVREAL